jgi:imidazolonepropionase-like amidohydrolase
LKIFPPVKLLILLILLLPAAHLYGDRPIEADSSAAPFPLTVVHAGWVLAVPGEAPVKEQSIFIRNGRIVDIRNGYQAPEDATLIDLKTSFLLPGLIDLHVHLTSAPEPGGELEDVTNGPADLALVGAVHAERLLRAGFTSILDMGTGRRTHEDAVFALRKAIADSLIPGPRIFAVGSPLSIPGQSRAMRFNSAVEAAVGPENVCVGVDECSRVVREQVQRGADVINVYNTGSLLSIPSVPITFTEVELRAIADTAHALGRSVIADGGNTKGDAAGINAALQAGFDAIDTVTYPDAETWRLLKKHNAYFIPHLYAVQAAVGDTPDTLQAGSMGWLPQPILEFLYQLKQETPSAIDAKKAGVRFAFGSDPGVFPHGDNAREFAELVRVGLSAEEAIVSATTAAAAVLRRSDEIGSIEPGKFADMIAVENSPLTDVRELEQVIWVMKGGLVYLSP